MFGLFRSNPAKRLRKDYQRKLEEAMHAQRNGDMRAYAFRTVEAEEIRNKLEAAEAATEQA